MCPPVPMTNDVARMRDAFRRGDDEAAIEQARVLAPRIFHEFRSASRSSFLQAVPLLAALAYVTKHTSGCQCTTACTFPCWQRYGIAPACEVCGCQAFDID